MKLLWLAAGLAFVGLGVVGAFVPLMPSTVFFIVAAIFFARSSPRLERWLLDHPQFGPGLKAWRAERAVPLRAKILACAGMVLGFILFLLGAHPANWLAITVAVLLIACAVFIITRPRPSATR